MDEIEAIRSNAIKHREFDESEQELRYLMDKIESPPVRLVVEEFKCQPVPGVGQKWDQGKLSWKAMPLEVLQPLAEVFNAGVKKGYGEYNCLQPFEDADRRFYDGMMRHVVACQLDPLAIDEETGCFHAAQVAFNTLLRLYHCRKVVDAG